MEKEKRYYFEQMDPIEKTKEADCECSLSNCHHVLGCRISEL